MQHKPLWVGLDLTGLWRQATGIFRYASEVARQLLLLPEEDKQIKYIFFFAREIPAEFLPLKEKFQTVICPIRNEQLLKQCWFPFILPGLHLDVMHYPAFPPPLFQVAGPPTIMTMHDAGPWRHPETLTLQGRLYFRTLLTRGARTCSQIITVSEHAKSEIGYFLGTQAFNKTIVIPEAASPAFAVSCSDVFKAEVRSRYRLPGQYYLAVATLEPRKNLVTLLKAYSQLKQQVGEQCPPLVIVGRKGWHYSDILGHMEELREAIIFPGHVTDEELIALYQMALCLVFPSLYEGFGLPVVEAMSAGCPVITSTTSSLPEVAGKAALLVDPLDVDALAVAIRSVLEDERQRTRMIRKGRDWVTRFSWGETARLTREVYIQAARSGK